MKMSPEVLEKFNEIVSRIKKEGLEYALFVDIPEEKIVQNTIHMNRNNMYGILKQAVLQTEELFKNRPTVEQAVEQTMKTIKKDKWYKKILK